MAPSVTEQQPCRPSPDCSFRREAAVSAAGPSQAEAAAAGTKAAVARGDSGAETAAEGDLGSGSELADGRHRGAAHTQRPESRRRLFIRVPPGSSGPPDPRPCSRLNRRWQAARIPRSDARRRRTRPQQEVQPPASPSYQRSQQPRNSRRHTHDRWRLDRMSTSSLQRRQCEAVL
jgi:hypothetical protein